MRAYVLLYSARIVCFLFVLLVILAWRTPVDCTAELVEVSLSKCFQVCDVRQNLVLLEHNI
jgi:hypothetical protein